MRCAVMGVAGESVPSVGVFVRRCSMESMAQVFDSLATTRMAIVLSHLMQQ